MIESWERHITDELNLNKSAKYLIAVSGGVDSIVLIDLFSRSGLSFAIAHCNFSLRGEESDKDETFVKELSEQYNVEFYTKAFDTQSYANSKKVSIQMAARDLRYQWFQDLIVIHGFDHIVTAHHANDNLETVIFNLVKGTGISGLRGMIPSNGSILRPLLPFKKSTLEGYANENNLRWREDSSNQLTGYKRNLIRHKVIPVLKQINPDVENTMQTMFEKLSATENLIKGHIEHICKSLIESKGDLLYINKEKLRNVNENLFILSELLKPFGFNYSQSRNIVSSIDLQSGKQFLSQSHQLTIDRKYLIIGLLTTGVHEEYEIAKDVSQIELSNQNFFIKKMSAKNYKISPSSSVAALNLDKIVFPLKLRHWKEGDWFIPLGMDGRKKLSDFMIDEKIPLNLKKDVLVLCSEESILWVIGHRIDDRYKVSEETSDVLEIKYKDNV